MLKFIFFFFVFSFLIRFIMRVVWPLFRGVSLMNGKIRQMQDHMQDRQSAPPPPKQTPRQGEYIDFEEVK